MSWQGPAPWYDPITCLGGPDGIWPLIGEFIKIYAQLPRLRFCLISSCSKLFLLTHTLNLINSTFRCVLTFEEVDVSPGSLDLYLESDKLGSRVRAYVSRIASQALHIHNEPLCKGAREYFWAREIFWPFKGLKYFLWLDMKYFWPSGVAEWSRKRFLGQGFDKSWVQIP